MAEDRTRDVGGSTSEPAKNPINQQQPTQNPGNREAAEGGQQAPAPKPNTNQP